MALSDNCVAYYKFSNDLLDSTANGNDLTNASTANTASGKIGDGRTVIATSASRSSGTGIPTGDSSISYSVWINPADLSAPRVFVSTGSASGGGTAGTYLAMWANASLIRLTQGSGDELDYSVTLSTGTFYHIVGVYDTSDNSLRTYVNGTSVATKSGITSLNLGSDIALGKFVYGGNEFNGVIDELGIWSRALTSGEVTSLYNSGTGLQYPFGTHSTIAIGTGSYSATGVSAMLKAALRIAIAAGSYALTGISAAFARGKSILASAGSYVLTGVAAAIRLRAWTNQQQSSGSWTNDTRS